MRIDIMRDKKLAYAAIAIAAALVMYFVARGGAVPTSSSGNVFVGHVPQYGGQERGYNGGNVLTDEGCQIDERTGLSNCTTEIRTSGGTYSFNYEHDMMAQPCLSEGDIANIHVSSDGSAVVTRTYWAGGGA